MLRARVQQRPRASIAIWVKIWVSRGELTAPAVRKLLAGNARHIDMDIDAVQERPTDPFLPARDATAPSAISPRERDRVHVFHATLAGARHESTPYIGPRRAGARRFQKETTMVTEDIAQRSAQAWLEAWNAHDLEAIMACYAAHPTLTSPRVVQWLDLPDGTVRGREQLRDYFAHGLRVAPALHFALRDILMGVEGVAIAYTRETGVQVVDAHKLDADGKITEAHVYVAPKRAPARGT